MVLLNRRLIENPPVTFIALKSNKLGAMETLKAALMTLLVLALEYPNVSFILHSDACNVRLGCFILQTRSDDTTKPIGCWSQLLTDTKRRYDTTQRECMAMVRSILFFLPYLAANRFIIRTDHVDLNWILGLTSSTKQPVQWRRKFSKFDFVVVYCTGIKHQADDTLSQFNTFREEGNLP